MQRSQTISKSIKLHFNVNLLNLVPFVITIITGLVLQFEFHMHHLPDGCVVSGLNKSGWLILHKISATISLAGIVFHCVLHRKFIAGITKKIFQKNLKTRTVLSCYLLIIYVPTFLAAMGSWLCFNHEDAARFALVEIHDKLALLLIVFFVVHVITRSGWMVRTYQRMRKTGSV